MILPCILMILQGHVLRVHLHH